MPLNSRFQLWWLRYASSRTRFFIFTVIAVGTLFGVHFQWRNRLTYTPDSIKYSWVHRIDSSLFPVSSDGSSPAEIPDDGKLRYAHMGMLNRLPNASLAAVFQGSKRHFEGSMEQSLYWSISEDNGMSWGPVQVLVASEGLPVWSPVMLTEGRRLWLMYSRSSRKCKYFDGLRGVVRYSPGGDIVMTTSDNNGKTWSSPQVIFGADAEDGIPKVIANRISVLSNGRWVLPFWREPGKTCPINRNQVHRSEWVNGSAGVLFSETQGLSWSVSGKMQMEESWLIENTVTQVKSGFLLQLFRTGLGSVYQSWSPDFGNTWSTPLPTTLPNPNSKVHLMTLSNGYLMVAYNHSPSQRSPLNVALSRDQGRSWRMVGELETDASLQYAYPTMDQKGPQLVVIYTVMKSDDAYRLICMGMKIAILDLKHLS
mmetsp:Transcript_7476/g.21115  ORF Transcript_7476/g.21115 Transcript_7476/m.21115 type:complete len:425 (-) Transcript_7476:193-1467(-)